MCGWTRTSSACATFAGERTHRPYHRENPMRHAVSTVRHLCVLCALCGAGPGPSAEPPQRLEVRGILNVDLSGLHDYRTEARDQMDFSGTSRLSLTATNRDQSHAKIELALDATGLFGTAATHPSLAGGDETVLQNLLSRGDAELFAVNDVRLQLELRKLYLALYLPFADISFGRQVVNFGKGTVFSPMDVFSSVDVFDLDLRRTGSTVALVRVPMGTLAGLDLIGELAYADSPFSTAAKVYATLGSTDLSLVGIYRDPGRDSGAVREGLVGIGGKGDLLVGVYGEAVVHLREGGPRAYAEAMAGVDYSVRNVWVFMAEYQYRDHGWYRSTWGEHALFLSVQFIPVELLSVAGSVLYDFEHELALGTVSCRYNLRQNVDLELYGRGVDGVAGILYDAVYGVRAAVTF